MWSDHIAGSPLRPGGAPSTRDRAPSGGRAVRQGGQRLLQAFRRRIGYSVSRRSCKPRRSKERFMPTASALVQRLHTVGRDLSTSLASQIVALGPETTPLLLGLLEEHPPAGTR